MKIESHHFAISVWPLNYIYSKYTHVLYQTNKKTRRSVFASSNIKLLKLTGIIYTIPDLGTIQSNLLLFDLISPIRLCHIDLYIQCPQMVLIRLIGTMLPKAPPKELNFENSSGIQRTPGVMNRSVLFTFFGVGSFILLSAIVRKYGLSIYYVFPFYILNDIPCYIFHHIKYFDWIQNTFYEIFNFFQITRIQFKNSWKEGSKREFKHVQFWLRESLIYVNEQRS